MKVNPRDPGDSPAADAPDGIIVIFGAAVRPDGRPSGTLRYRVLAAIRLGRSLDRPLFIPTGARGRYGQPEAAVMETILLDAGFPPEAVLKEETGTDTLSSVKAVRRMLKMLPKAPVYACTSAYHLPRCLMLLRLAGIPARACPPPRVPAATSWTKRWYWRLREFAALPYDATLMVWHRSARRFGTRTES
jgi:uncharacterized SAM-binding protein YcdF (DUF218 family)